METKKTKIGTAQTMNVAVQDNGGKKESTDVHECKKKFLGNATSHDCPVCDTHADAVRWVSGMGSERLCPKCGWRGFTWQKESTPAGAMRQLTCEEIEKFSKRPRVRRIAVENFLYTVTNNPNVFDAYMNLDMDARLYRWNRETIKAIKDGIRLTVLRD